MKVVGFAGYSGSGKTHLLERLIPALRLRGLRVSVAKHAHHAFDIDHPGKDTYETSSPSMDISKASNFERFVFDLLGRDGAKLRYLFAEELPAKGRFTLGAEVLAAREQYGFVSGRSTHADRLATIRDTWERFHAMIDTHTADGLKVAREHLKPGVPMLVLETALPVKFAGTIVEALGREPQRPAKFEGIEKLPKRVTILAADVALVKSYIAAHCG